MGAYSALMVVTWPGNMKIYHLLFEDGYSGLHSNRGDPIQREFVEHVQMDKHDPVVACNWHSIKLYNQNPLLPAADFFWWGRYMCCTRQTYAKIEHATARDVRALPVEIENESSDYVLIHVANVRHATRDEEIKRLFEQQGHYRTMHYLFKWECFERPQVFMNATQEPSQMFCVSDCGDEVHDFHLEYKRLGLTGIQFKCVAERETP